MSEQDPRTYYEQNGYYICRQLIPQKLIDQLLTEYQANILPSPNYFFRQSSNRWQVNTINAFGYCTQSFLDVHDYPQYSAFTEAAKKVFCAKPVREILTTLTGSNEHNLMQSMFFDLNTATPAHQDWYYLDSLPNGYLLAGWFALEDIQAEAGRFYVLPGSHLVDFELTKAEKVANAPYVKKLKEYLAEHQEDIYAPALEKGDVLLWNSRTIHGSLETINPQYSRKSLTAHYLPAQYQFGKRYEETPIPVEYGEHEGMKYRLAPEQQKYYSLSAKLKTDFFEYLWQRPKLKQMVDLVKNPLKSLQKR